MTIMLHKYYICYMFGQVLEGYIIFLFISMDILCYPRRNTEVLSVAKKEIGVHLSAAPTPVQQRDWCDWEKNQHSLNRSSWLN